MAGMRQKNCKVGPEWFVVSRKPWLAQELLEMFLRDTGTSFKGPLLAKSEKEN